MGTVILKSGTRTGISCGHIESTSLVTSNFGSAYLTNLYADQGDSGSIVFSSDTTTNVMVVGIVLGGHDPSGINGTIVAKPLRIVSEIGANVD